MPIIIEGLQGGPAVGQTIGRWVQEETVRITETTAGRTNPLGGTTVRLGSNSAGEYLNATIRTIETRRTASDAELPLLAA